MQLIRALKHALGPSWRLLRKVSQRRLRNPDRFLRDVRGVVHVGANDGSERNLYREFGLNVLWIEPLPDVFEKLELGIRGYEAQRAVRALVTDVNGRIYDFHIACNGGASSSIFAFKDHKHIWPDINFTQSVQLESVTLPTLLQREGLDARSYDALILDTQGSELLVLRGAIPILSGFRYVKAEVADFEAYEGCCQLPELAYFMREHAYREVSRTRFAGRPGVGNYYDIVYRRRH